MIELGDVGDERIGGGAAFGDEDALKCLWVEGVCAESVDGFGGEGDKAATADELRGLSDELRFGCGWGDVQG